MGLFLVKEIKSKAGKLHFRRWRLFDSPWFGIYVHYIAAADEDKHPHDHPWSFVGVCLKGGYEEELISNGGDSNRRFISSYLRSTIKPGSVFFRSKNNQYHKIKKILNPTWTIVFHGPKRDTWGYWTEDGWIDHRTYRSEKRAGRWDNEERSS